MSYDVGILIRKKHKFNKIGTYDTAKRHYLF